MLLASAGLSPKGDDGDKPQSKQSAYERRVARFSVPARFYSHKEKGHASSAGAGGATAGAKFSPRLKRVGQGAKQQQFLNFYFNRSFVPTNFNGLLLH